MNRLRRKEKKQEASAPTTTTTNRATTTSNTAAATEDVFEARRSTRTASVKADGDTWTETLAVCQVKGKLTIRPYFTNQRTSDRVWDEPPSGASTVEHATDEMRKMAQVQLEEMQVTVVAADNENNDAATPKEKRGLFGRSNKTKQPKQRGKIQYKPGSILRSRKQPTTQFAGNEAMDPHVQAAIALSMADQSGIEHSTFQNGNDDKTAAYQQEADEELAMAMALSLSENTHDDDDKKEGDLLGFATMPSTDEDPVIVATVEAPHHGRNETAATIQQPQGAQPRSNLKQWPPPQQQGATNENSNGKTGPSPATTTEKHTLV